MRQFDAHVRARLALARKVANRRRQWGLRDFRAQHAALFAARDWDAIDALLLASAIAAIADYSGANERGRSLWSEGWGNKYGAYSPFDGAPLLGQHKGYPASVVHSIMCRLTGAS
jgi:hypothetical protein